MSVALERFIKARLRVLFRMVHDLKTSRDGSVEVDMDSDVLGQVESTVEDWAREKRMEISELKEREQFRREFIGNLAHELRTPLFNMQGYVLTLLDGGLEDPKINRDFLQRAARATDRLIKIAEDMDVIAKLESGVMEMQMEPVDLEVLVRGELDDAMRGAVDKGIQLKCEVGPGTLVMADPQRLAQVFTNLIDNAIHYGRPGGMVIVRAIKLMAARCSWRSATTGSALRRSTCRAFSSASTAWARAAHAMKVDPVWVFPSSSTSSRRMASRSR